MNQRILFIGLDVDDKAFHGYGIYGDSGEEFEFRCKPTVGALQSKLAIPMVSGAKARVCYEATYLGFSLHRRLKSVGIDCEVIAPSLVPRSPSEQVKTDRLDCRKLARLYRKGELTAIHVPDGDEEMHRDLIRSRHFLQDQLKAVKLHVLSLCRRMDINYRQATGRKNYWTLEHQRWLNSKVSEASNPQLRFNLVTLLNQLNQMRGQIESYNAEIERLAEEPAYRRKVSALCCYRGVSTLTAMTFITEIGDARRFTHPKMLTSFSGFDIREYSSGDRKTRYGITKMGNRHIRTAAVESVQRVHLKPNVSKRLRAQRKDTDPMLIDIADRCMVRLYKKSRKLFSTGKHRNKVKVACARELLCFVWESLNAAA